MNPTRYEILLELLTNIYAVAKFEVKVPTYSALFYCVVWNNWPFVIIISRWTGAIFKYLQSV